MHGQGSRVAEAEKCRVTRSPSTAACTSGSPSMGPRPGSFATGSAASSSRRGCPVRTAAPVTPDTCPWPRPSPRTPDPGARARRHRLSGTARRAGTSRRRREGGGAGGGHAGARALRDLARERRQPQGRQSPAAANVRAGRPPGYRQQAAEDPHGFRPGQAPAPRGAGSGQGPDRRGHARGNSPNVPLGLPSANRGDPSS